MVSDSGRPVTQEEIRHMEQEVSKMEYDLYEFYCDVGKGILEKAEQENRKINGMVDDIIEARLKLAKAKREKCCPACVQLNDHNSVYCKRCGAQLPETCDSEEDNHGAR